MAVCEVEGGDRLIAEQESRARCECSRQADPLPLAAGERFGTSFEQMFHAAQRGHLGEPGLAPAMTASP